MWATTLPSRRRTGIRTASAIATKKKSRHGLERLLRDMAAELTPRELVLVDYRIIT
jgi:hypothetical protein